MAVELPATWERIALSDAMDAIIDYRGKSPTKTVRGVPLITAKIVKNGRIETPNEFIEPGEYENWMRRGLPRSGDVLLTTEAPLGEVAQIGDERVALAQRLIALRGKIGRVDNTFLKYLMLSDFVQEQLRARSSGTTVLGIRQSELRKIELPLPPFPEQVTIANVLGSLDEKIELNRRMNQTLITMARAIFTAWFVQFDPVRAKMAGMTTFRGMSQDLFDSLPDRLVESQLGPIPRGWNVVRFSNLVNLFGGGTPKRKVPSYWAGRIPWFSVRDAPSDSDLWVIDTEERITESGSENSAAKVMRTGTTIISARGTVGRLALTAVPMAMNQSCYGVQGANGVGDFFAYFSLLDAVAELQQRTHGSVFDTITRNTFDMLNRVRPQPRLLEAFEDAITPHLWRIRNNRFESRTLAAIRDALLPKLISGQIRVPDAEGMTDGR